MPTRQEKPAHRRPIAQFSGAANPVVPVRAIRSTTHFFLSWLLLGVSSLSAGLVSSDVVVVVNGNSLDSRALANHYVWLRNIPAANIVVLDRVPNAEVISIDDFRQKILAPLLLELDRRKLSNHVQCVAYSCDFPTAIDIQTDLKPLGKLPIFFTSRASINALTYFYQFVQAGNPNYIQLNANSYARREMDAFFTNPLGALTETRWSELQAQIAAGEHQAAAESLTKLATEFPSQFPIAYLAAAQFAKANDTQAALDWLEKAVAGGWSAGGYLQEDERFTNCRDDSRYQLLQLSLDETQAKYQPTVGFEAKRAWGTNGVPAADLKLGSRYLLSTVLGVTRGAGTTLKQAMDSLERSAKADFTQPDGGFYFCLTSDVRTTTRQPGFADAIETLQSLGFEAEVVSESLPKGKAKVLGAMLGTPNFDWSTSGSTLLPGSIAENLTSVGAVMNSLGGQTKLTELIKAGAAGSSGTVTEPYAIQPKFPHPQLYVHYARGLSLAESFYASVTGPYQLLVIGDPLCQPFATPPKLKVAIELRKLASDEPLRLPLDYEREAIADGKRAPNSALAVSILFGDAPPQTAAVQSKVEIKLNATPPGYYEARLISVGDDALMQRSEVALPLWIGDADTVTLSAPEKVAFSDRKVTVKAAAKTAKSLTVWHDSEQLAIVSGAEGEFSIPLAAIGIGKIRLHARAELENGSVSRSVPVILEVTP